MRRVRKLKVLTFEFLENQKQYINQKNAFGLYFSGQPQDLSQSLPLKVSIRGQGKTGWTKQSILFYVCEYLDNLF